MSALPAACLKNRGPSAEDELHGADDSRATCAGHREHGRAQALRATARRNLGRARRLSQRRLADSGRQRTRGISQGDVWDEVRAQHLRLGVSSPTGASADAYRRWQEPLATLEDAFPLQPGQSGAVLALGDDLCLDYVSRPDAFERLYPKLLRGYLLDALGRLDGPAAQPKTVAGFVDEVVGAERTRRPSAGLGEDL